MKRAVLFVLACLIASSLFAQPADEILPGWKVRNGEWVRKGTILECQSAGGLASGQTDIADFVCSGKFLIEAPPGKPSGLRIDFRATSEMQQDGMYFLSMGNADDPRAMFVRVPVGWPESGTYHPFRESQCSLRPGDWNSFQLSVVKGVLSCKINDQKIEVVDETFQSGYVGVRFWRCVGKIDQLELQVLRTAPVTREKAASLDKTGIEGPETAKPEDKERRPQWGTPLQEVEVGDDLITLRVRGAVGHNFAVLPVEGEFPDFSLSAMLWIEQLDPGAHFEVRFRSDFQAEKKIGHDDSYRWGYYDQKHRLYATRRATGHTVFVSDDLEVPRQRWIPLSISFRDNFVSVSLGTEPIVRKRLPEPTLGGTGIYFALLGQDGLSGEVRLKDVRISRSMSECAAKPENTEEASETRTQEGRTRKEPAEEEGKEVSWLGDESVWVFEGDTIKGKAEDTAKELRFFKPLQNFRFSANVRVTEAFEATHRHRGICFHFWWDDPATGVKNRLSLSYEIPDSFLVTDAIGRPRRYGNHGREKQDLFNQWFPIMFQRKGDSFGWIAGPLNLEKTIPGIPTECDFRIAVQWASAEIRDLELVEIDEQEEPATAKASAPATPTIQQPVATKPARTGKPVTTSRRFWQREDKAHEFYLIPLTLANAKLNEWLKKMVLGDEFTLFVLVAQDTGMKENYEWSDADSTIRMTVVEDKARGVRRSYGNVAMCANRLGYLFELERNLTIERDQYRAKAHDTRIDQIVEVRPLTKVQKEQDEAKKRIELIENRLRLMRQARPLFESVSIPTRERNYAIVAFKTKFDVSDIESVDFKKMFEDYEPMKELRYFNRLEKDLGIVWPEFVGQ